MSALLFFPPRVARAPLAHFLLTDAPFLLLLLLFLCLVLHLVLLLVLLVLLLVSPLRALPFYEVLEIWGGDRVSVRI
jgi:hypothetical protein